jgi:rSAM/selenodomain-associated transferase 1
MNQFGAFAKYWKPGTVKTRLGAGVGNDAAAAFHRICVELLAERFATLGNRRVLCGAPADRVADFQTLAGEAWVVETQSEGDLGERMHAYFEDAFSAGMERVILIGSDSPNLPVSFIEQAFDALKSHDAVLGPSEDGGYYLVGARNQVPPIFRGVTWSSGEVWKQSVSLFEKNNFKWHQLPHWYDIDNVDDLIRLQNEVAALTDSKWKSLQAFLSTLDLPA